MCVLNTFCRKIINLSHPFFQERKRLSITRSLVLWNHSHILHSSTSGCAYISPSTCVLFHSCAAASWFLKTTMNIPTDLVTQFCRVTNANEALASELLRDSGLDLQAAISSFFAIQDAGGLPPESSDEPEAVSVPPNEVNDVPDTTTEATAVPRPRSSSHGPSGRSNRLDWAQGHGLRAQTNRTRLDPFLSAEGTGSVRGEALASLFRPPVHLIHTGTLNESMASGRSQQRWVLVNVQQRDVFACHMMNRDIWSDSTVQQLLQAHFVFWQRDVTECNDYSSFYSVGDPPHVAVLDPRNGERVRVWGDNGQVISKVVLLDALQDFVSGNSLDSDATIRGRNGGRPSRSDRTYRSNLQSSQSATVSENAGGAATVDADDDPSNEINDPMSLPENSEDAQLAAAIAASMENHSADWTDSADTGDMEREVSRVLSSTDPALNQHRSLRAEQDNAYQEALMLDRAKEESERTERVRMERQRQEDERRQQERLALRELKRKRVPEPPEDGKKGGVTELAIRLPDGKRLQRKFFATDNVGNVYDFVECEAEQLDGVTFELMTMYPRKRYADRSASLQELAPRAALVVDLKD